MLLAANARSVREALTGFGRRPRPRTDKGSRCHRGCRLGPCGRRGGRSTRADDRDRRRLLESGDPTMRDDELDVGELLTRTFSPLDRAANAVLRYAETLNESARVRIGGSVR